MVLFSGGRNSITFSGLNCWAFITEGGIILRNMKQDEIKSRTKDEESNVPSLEITLKIT